nr:hypothetical protein [Klebsiella pneumoniae]
MGILKIKNLTTIKKDLIKNIPVDKWITPMGGDFAGIERMQNL